jgi:hypothetical protein
MRSAPVISSLAPLRTCSVAVGVEPEVGDEVSVVLPSSPQPQSYSSSRCAQSKIGFSKRSLTWLCTKHSLKENSVSQVRKSIGTIPGGGTETGRCLRGKLLQQLLKFCSALAAWIQTRRQVEIRPERLAFVLRRMLSMASTHVVGSSREHNNKYLRVSERHCVAALPMGVRSDRGEIWANRLTVISTSHDPRRLYMPTLNSAAHGVTEGLLTLRLRSPVST